MGMFDDIKFKIKCPKCKTKMDNFQSKDSVCAMMLLEFWEVNNFYASCPECSSWVEYTIKKRPNKRLTIKDYKREVRISTKKEEQEHKGKYKALAKLLSQSDKEVKP